MQVYGSFQTKLRMPWSDIDIVISSSQLKESEILDKIFIEFEVSFK